LYALDTNVLIHDPNALLNFQEHHVAIPMTVLEELDKLKTGKQGVAAECRQAIRLIDKILGGATPEEVEHGVPIQREKSGPCGFLSILMSKRAAPITWLPEDLNDNKIINQLVELKSRKPGMAVVLVTKDINMRLKGAPVASTRRTTTPTNWSTTYPCCRAATTTCRAPSGTA
jgi:PhoH-like ATPase